MDFVDDPGHERLADYRHLTDAAARRSLEGSDGDGIFIVEGVLALRQLLRSRYHVRSILSTPARADAVRAELGDVPVDHRAEVPHLVATRGLVEDVTGFDVHRGVLAAADRGPTDAPDVLLSSARRVLVADGVNDHENLGSLFRNGAAIGMDGVLLDDSAADPLYRRSIRVSAGWTMRLPYTRIGPSTGLPARLHGAGFTTIALTPDPAAVPVDRAAADGWFDGRVAFVVGSEGPGLSDEVLADCRVRVRIPMSGEVDSLNVATSFAVVASFAAARRGWT